MKKKLFLSTISAALSLGFLSACGVDNNQMNDPEGVDFRPVRYDNRQDDNGFNNDRLNIQNQDVPRVRTNRDNNFDWDMNNNRTNDGFFNTNNNDRYNRSLWDNDNNDNDNGRGENEPRPGVNGGNVTGR